uniref:Uncharacterized protein n=1 Tax=Amphiprion percula TaxID=161767 RepID=A0A3P8RMF6_AMPPE
QECEPCHRSCRACGGPRYDDCDSCEDECAHYHFFHNGTCVDDCPDGYFANDKQDECVRCHADCGSCDGPGFDDCIECRNKKAVRYNGECLPKCPKGTYYDETTNECRDCDRSCLTCSGHEPSSCLSCDTDRRKDASGHCVWYRQCSLQSYVDQNGECQQCHELCHRCSGPGKDHCLSCNDLSFMFLLYKKDTSSPEVLTLHLSPSDNTCVQECPVGYYADKDVRVCERCHFTCQSCVGRHSVECLICKPGFFKQGINCVETCSERLEEQVQQMQPPPSSSLLFFPSTKQMFSLIFSHFGNKTTMLCERCDPSCSKCWGHSNRNCLSCREGYVYLRPWGQCLQRCPLGYYQDSQSKTCQKCHPTCKSCTGKGSLSWLVTLFV